MSRALLLCGLCYGIAFVNIRVPPARGVGMRAAPKDFLEQVLGGIPEMELGEGRELEPGLEQWKVVCKHEALPQQFAFSAYLSKGDGLRSPFTLLSKLPKPAGMETSEAMAFANEWNMNSGLLGTLFVLSDDLHLKIEVDFNWLAESPQSLIDLLRTFLAANVRLYEGWQAYR